MQTRLRIALAAAGFALGTIPGFAAEMPTDGSKNFSPPTDAPSYFTNETVPESARVDRQADFTSEDVATAPDVGPAVSAETDTGQRERHASAHRSTRHSAGKSGRHGTSTHYAKASTSKATSAGASHATASHTNTGSRSASAAKGGGTQAGASKPSATKHARTNTRQHATAMPSGTWSLSPEA